MLKVHASSIPIIQHVKDYNPDRKIVNKRKIKELIDFIDNVIDDLENIEDAQFHAQELKELFSELKRCQ